MITSRQHELIKTMRRLRRSKDDTLAVLEGPHLLAEAIASGIELCALLVTPERAAQPETAGLLARSPLPPRLAAAAVLDDLADADAPQGLLALVRLPRPGVRELPVAEGIYLYLDGVQDPGNLGAIARVAEASGVIVGLALGPGSAHPNHPRALRAAAGSLLRLPVARQVEAAALADHLAALAPQWLALVPSGGESLWSSVLPGNLVVCLGAEGAGLRPEVLARAGRRVTIPLAPPVESLNVAVAAALLLYERRRRADTT